MLYIIAILIVTVLVFTIIRAGATALELTGVSRDVAKFQALSAFFGVGFTTEESELVVNHPVRRRIIRDLIIIGNIGIMSVLGTVVVTAGDLDFKGDPSDAWFKVIVIAAGLLALWGLTKTPIPRWIIDQSVNKMLGKSGMLHSLDYEELLRVRSGFVIEKFIVHAESPLIGKALGDVKPREFGINVLGIVRDDGQYIGAPRGASVFESGDEIIIYGEHTAVTELLTGEAREAPSNPGI